MLSLGIDVRSEIADAALGIAVGRGCHVRPAQPELEGEIGAAIQAVAPESANDERRAHVRGLLRHGRYRPTGRGKPASEYLARNAAEGAFPRINNLVDIINLVSLRTMLPISLIDIARAGTDRFAVRWGRAGESYAFNSAGQTIDLEDLILVAALPEDRPCANPVKDSMATKLTADSSEILAVVYAPVGLADVAEAAARDLASRFALHGAAREVDAALLK